MQALHDKLEREDRRLVVAIEGNIGSGKSTLLNAIVHAYPEYVEIVPEPIDVWRDCNGYNLLEAFYSDPHKYAYMFQSFAIATRIMGLMKTLQDTTKRIILVERSPFSDEIFVRQCVKQGYMNDTEYAAYDRWRDYLWEQPKNLIHGIIYLRTSAMKCYQRMWKRDRQEENNVSIEYLETLGKLHDKWLYQDTSNYIIVEHREHLANKPVEVLDNENTQLQKQIAFIPSLLEMLDHASAFTTVYKEKSHELDV